MCILSDGMIEENQKFEILELNITFAFKYYVLLSYDLRCPVMYVSLVFSVAFLHAYCFKLLILKKKA